MSHTDDTSRGHPPLSFQHDLALKLLALCALVALLIIGHWAFLYAFGTPARPVSCVTLLVEAAALLVAISALVFGGGAMLLDGVLMRLGLSSERRDNVWSALWEIFFLPILFLHATRDSDASSHIVFTLGATPLNDRDMAFFAMGVVLLLTTLNGLAALGLLEFPARRKRQG